ncbi:Transcription termination/antitermination protein NusG [bioreactor metagenome]|uniref:Transcription termination/antitermination protein NusG n=1 Tax=bioreactor metagenome TaxID=1076179 RepID=A0A645J932_9ZZZZ
MGPEVHVMAAPRQLWKVGERVVITEGAFEGFEGVVAAVDDERQRLTIEVVIFDRKTPAELEFWQVESAE